MSSSNPMDGGAWWAAVHGVVKSRRWLSNFTFNFYFHALEKEMATHSSVLAWRIPGMGEPDGLPSMGPHRVGHDWSNLAAWQFYFQFFKERRLVLSVHLKDWCWSWNSNTLATWCEQLTHFEKTLMLRKIEGSSRRGWQMMRWLDGIINSMDMFE